MPSTKALVVNDGTNDITFSPDSVTGTHVQFQDLSQAVVQQRSLLHLDRPANGKASEIRRSIRINVPYAVTNADGSVAVKQLSIKVEAVSPSDTTVAQRASLRALASHALTNVDVAAVFDNPEWMW